MARKQHRALRKEISLAIQFADLEWWEEDCKESTGERDEDYFNFLAKRVVKALEIEGYILF